MKERQDKRREESEPRQFSGTRPDSQTVHTRGRTRQQERLKNVGQMCMDASLLRKAEAKVAFPPTFGVSIILTYIPQ
jgi:hypothetical protein